MLTKMNNMAMSAYQMLGGMAPSVNPPPGTTPPPGGGGGGDVDTQPIEDALSQITHVLTIVLVSLLGLIGIFAIGIAIWIGFKMATATDDTKRKDAKKQLIYALVAIVAVMALIIVWFAVRGPLDRLIRQAAEPING